MDSELQEHILTSFKHVIIYIYTSINIALLL